MREKIKKSVKDNLSEKYNVNFLDRAINFLSPTRGAERLKGRIQTAVATGGYNGGSISRRQTKSWTPTTRDADSETRYDRKTIINRSRDALINNAMGGAAINTLTLDTIGPGLKLQAQIDSDYLGMTEDEADVWETKAEREFNLFADSKDCDLSRMQNFSDMQDLVYRSARSSGDVFILLPTVKRRGVPFDLKLQVIEADRINNAGGQADSANLTSGIEKDKFGAPVRVHIQKTHPGALVVKSEWDKVEIYGQKSGRLNVIHLLDIDRPGQSRGVPFLAPVLELLKQLSDLTEAELSAAVITSMLTVFVKSETGESTFLGTEENGDSETTDEEYRLGNGSIVELNEDEDISIVDPKRPNAAFDPFFQAIVRQIGARLGIPFERLVIHFTSSYSASRGALLQLWKLIEKERAWFARNFCDLVYHAVLDEAISKGRIDAPGYFANPLIKKAYRGAAWNGPTRGQIDPLKEVNAANKRIELCISSRTQETAEYSGRDWTNVQRKLAKETEILRENGLYEELTEQPAKTQLDETQILKDKIEELEEKENE